MNKVSLSLIIPTFNRPHLLPRAVESARRAGREVEVIVVDDASTDHTADVCAALRDIKYVRLDRNREWLEPGMSVRKPCRSEPFASQRRTSSSLFGSARFGLRGRLICAYYGAARRRYS